MKKTFTAEQIALLAQNRYTKLISPSMIKFTEDFKEDFWRLYLTDMPVKEIYRSLGYDPSIFGEKRINGFVYNLRKAYLTDKQREESQTRSSKVKRPPADVEYSKMKSLDAIRAMETELTYLRQEVAFLKKLYALVPPSSKEDGK
jgi:hypothetical protein